MRTRSGRLRGEVAVRPRKTIGLAIRATTVLAAVLLFPGLGAAQADPAGPSFDLKVRWGPTLLPPAGEGQFGLEVRNIGAGGATEETLTIVDELPPGVTATAIHWSKGATDLSGFCSGVATGTVNCAVPPASVPALAPAPGAAAGFLTPRPTGYLPPLLIDVAIDAQAAGSATNVATVTGGGATQVARESVVGVAEATTPFGVLPASFEADAFGGPYPSPVTPRQAGSHPFEQRFNFDLTTRSRLSPEDGTRQTVANGLLRTIQVHLPQGFYGNPIAVPRCDPADFVSEGSAASSTACPPESQVGYLNLTVREPGRPYGLAFFPHITTRVPIYNIEPPRGILADFGFNVLGLVQQHLYLRFDPERNYAIEVVAPFVSSLMSVLGAEMTIWGVPGDPEHDKFRYFADAEQGNVLGAPFDSAVIRPLLTTPSDCGLDNGGARIGVDSYEHPDLFSPTVEYPDPLDVEGCDDPRFRFHPALAMTGVSPEARSPSGAELTLGAPQRDDRVKVAAELYASSSTPQGIATPPIRKAVIRLPAGMSLSPGFAQGLSACTEDQMGLVSRQPVRFDSGDPTCPESSRIGTLQITTPLIQTPLSGSIYLASPRRNPYGTLLAAYMAIEDPVTGIVLKIPARLDLEPADGRIKVTLDDLPQLPFASFSMRFKSGPRAILQTPPNCGSYPVGYSLTPWSDPDPVEGTSNFTIDRGCARAPFHPRFSAGAVAPVAGVPSTFLAEVTREDDEPDLSSVKLTLPPGMTGRFGALAHCSEPQAEEERCPESSRVGSIDVSVGSGGVPLRLPGDAAGPSGIFLGGPYKGAQFSFFLALPTHVGPLDLGPVVVRATVDVDRRSGRLTVASDPLPDLIEGVPIAYRNIRLSIDRPNFAINPTNCEEMRVRATIVSRGGAVADVGERFQLGNCAALGLRPRLRVRLSKATSANGHPALSLELEPRVGDANARSLSLSMPRGELIDPIRFRGICSREEFAAAACPRSSVRGSAWLRSPLLGRPLVGPIYLRQSDGPYPELAIPLHGEADLTLVGRIRTPYAQVGASFDSLPDLPVSKLRLVLYGGKRGLLLNSEGLCDGILRAGVAVSGHNGRRRHIRPRVGVPCERSRPDGSR